jgi:hypothetical protein
MMKHDDHLSSAIVVPVGSRVTCNPPPTDTDEDYLILVQNKKAAVAALKSIGFESPQTQDQIDRYEKLNEVSQWSFSSLRFGDINYIVTESEFFFERFLTATHVCKSLNLMDKSDRIMVFDAVLGASFCDKASGGWRPDYGKWHSRGVSGANSNADLTWSLSDNVMRNIGAPTVLPDLQF